MTPPKIFISYSWKPVQNKFKVLQLAERLSADGVHVIIDDWDLKEGQDKYQFMEQMVNNTDVHRVLMICNKDYAEKANTKKGGVGIESLILSNEIYSKVDQTKFIPVAFEYNEHGNAYLPTFVHSRIYVDLSSDHTFEENYEKLLRNIFDKPSTKRPPIGSMPVYLEIDQPTFLPTIHKIAALKKALLEEKQTIPLYIQDYLDTFLKSLKDFSIDENDLTETNFDEIILKKIEELKYLRDDFIEFLEMYLTNSIVFDKERFCSFFENLLFFIENINDYIPNSSTPAYLKLDQFRFFYTELFLTFSALMIKRERFQELAFILQSTFIIEKKSTSEILQLTFVDFHFYIRSLNDFRKRKLQSNSISITADIIRQRASDKCDFELLKDTDLLLYYLSLLLGQRGSHLSYWFPETIAYRRNSNKLLPKTISQKYFDKVKVLFGVQDQNELVTKADDIDKNDRLKIHNNIFSVPSLRRGLGISEMCTIK